MRGCAGGGDAVADNSVGAVVVTVAVDAKFAATSTADTGEESESAVDDDDELQQGDNEASFGELWPTRGPFWSWGG